MNKTIFSDEQYSVEKFVLGPLRTNCYVITNQDNSAVLIDPGYCSKVLTDWLESKNINITTILLTHGHFDHVLGLKMFPNVPIYVHENDIELLLDNDKNAAKTFNLSVEYNKNNIINFTDDFTIPYDSINFKTIHTPGHTEGSTTYLAFNKILFTGDAIFAGTVGRCDLWGGSEEKTKETVKKISNLKEDYLIYPGHGKLSTLNNEKLSNPYFLQNQ